MFSQALDERTGGDLLGQGDSLFDYIAALLDGTLNRSIGFRASDRFRSWSARA